ncbi:MAG: non-homologous end-joining DNA ligase [Bacteroidota bacterium]
MIKTGKYSFEISNEDKLLFPDDGITKGDIINYYREMAAYIIPFTKGRPAMLQRFPNGISKSGFYQKDRSVHFPEWINSSQVKKEGGETTNMVHLDNEATLAYLANQGVISYHVWLSKVDNIHVPDMLIFDLDPPDTNGFDLVKKGARALKDLFENKLGMASFLKLSGSKGIHFIVPIKPEHQFNKVREFCSSAARFLSRENPGEFTIETRKDKRKGRLFIDYLRNSYAQTAVAPYSLRPIKEAPVAAPISWDEIEQKDLSPRQFNLKNINKRISQVEDPWKNFNRRRHSIFKPMKELLKMIDKQD